MKTTISLTLFFSCLGFSQTIPSALQVSRMYNVKSASQVIDNRSTASMGCNYYSFNVNSGTGAWTAQLEYSDVSNVGPWTVFGTGAIATKTPLVSIGYGNGNHSWVRINTTAGTTTSTFSCSKDYFLSPSVAGFISQASAISTIQNGAGAVIRTVQDKLNETACTVTDFGADPTGTADSLPAFNLALTACSTLIVPDGTFKLSNTLQINRNDFTMRCMSQKSILKYGGTTPINSLLQIGPDSPFNVRVENCMVRGDAAGNVNIAVSMEQANHSTVNMLEIKDAHTCFGHYGGVANTVDDVSCSINNGGFLFRPTIGMDFAGRTYAPNVPGTTTIVNRPIMEGIFGPGLKFKNTEAVTVIGGTSEANVIGILMVDISAAGNRFVGIGLEVNCLRFDGTNYYLPFLGACYGQYQLDGVTPYDVGVVDAGYQTQFIGGSYTDGYYHITSSTIGGPDHARGATIMDAKVDVVYIDSTVEDTRLEHNLMEITGTKIPGILSNGDSVYPYGINPTIIGNFKSNGGAIVATEQQFPGQLFLNSTLTIIPDASDQNYLTLIGRDRSSHGMRMHMAEQGNINYLEVKDTTMNPNWNVFISANKSFGGMDTFLYSTTVAGTPVAKLDLVAGGMPLWSNNAGVMPTYDSSTDMRLKGTFGADSFIIYPVHFAGCPTAVSGRLCRIDDYSGVPTWGAVVTVGTGVTGTYATLIYTPILGWNVFSL